jgi:hypothetical protein
VSRVRHKQTAPDVTVGEGGRWVLGNPVATCAKCGAGAAVHYATNGKAQFWHAPTDCCDWARDREHRFDAMAREDEHRTREWRERVEALR